MTLVIIVQGILAMDEAKTRFVFVAFSGSATAFLFTVRAIVFALFLVLFVVGSALFS